MMDRHLNIFKSFSQNQSKENIEDNLSRALVLCLKNNTLLFHEFLQHIFTEANDDEYYSYLFDNYTDQDTLNIDIQVNVKDLQDDTYRRIYAIAVTENHINLADFFSLTYSHVENYKPITDIVITVNDILFVLEVKRTNENCKQQLFNQIHQLTNNNIEATIIKPLSYDWRAIMSLVTRIANFQKINQKADTFLTDFIGLVSQFNITWLPLTPFASLSNEMLDNLESKRFHRLNAAINNTKAINSLNYSDRIGYDIDFGWAREILFGFERTRTNQLFLNAYIWPGNTKGQGHGVFSSPKLNDMLNMKHMSINNRDFEVIIEYNLKFCHFNKYVTGLQFTDDDLNSSIVNVHNFHKYAGKHNRNNWHVLEAFFDASFKPEFKWRDKALWDKKFVEMNRNYLTFSMGYQIKTRIPYLYLQEIDKLESDLDNVSDVLYQISLKYQDML